MCEPYHSVVQYPVDDNQGDSNESRLKWGLGKIYEWGKKIGSFFHFSKLGSGHTESIEWAKTRHLILPNDTRYETAWWDRTTRLDGFFNAGPGFLKDQALQGATEYSRVTVTGDIGKLRRFLEVSMYQSSAGYGYVEAFMDYMLTYPARDEIMRRCSRIWHMSPRLAFTQRKPGVIKLILGYTRKRNLLVPVWADDSRLWTAKSLPHQQ